jgi:hypothetical protein
MARKSTGGIAHRQQLAMWGPIPVKICLRHNKLLLHAHKRKVRKALVGLLLLLILEMHISNALQNTRRRMQQDITSESQN